MITYYDKIVLTEDTAHILTEIASRSDCTEFEIIEAIVEDWAMAKLTKLENEEWQN